MAEEVLRRMTGTIRQRPPAYSALKIGGQPAYKLARAGKAVELQERLVTIYSINLLDYAWPLAKLHIECGRGTYIRSLARDLGEALGTGAYLTALRRTHVGPFHAEQACTIEQLRNLGPQGCLAYNAPS
jgi:tRNA pseudouridine55 synthase